MLLLSILFQIMASYQYYLENTLNMAPKPKRVLCKPILAVSISRVSFALDRADMLILRLSLVLIKELLTPDLQSGGPSHQRADLFCTVLSHEQKDQ